MISTTDLAPASLIAKARQAPKLGELDLVREVAPGAIAPLRLAADSYDVLADQLPAQAHAGRGKADPVAAAATVGAATGSGAATAVVAICSQRTVMWGL